MVGVLKFEFPRSPFRGFSYALFEAQALCAHAIKI